MANKASDLLVIDKREAKIIYEWLRAWSFAGGFKKLLDKEDRTEAIEVDNLRKTLGYFISEED